MKLIALVGKPNVGKSTLFNRLARRRAAIVSHEAGTTRDRNIAPIKYKGYHFLLMDTGGFEPEAKEEIPQKMREQSQLAIEEADAVVFLLDYQSGLTPQDKEVFHYLRQSNKPVFVAVNKVDGDKHEAGVGEFWEIGAEEVIALSAEHGRGVMELLEKLEEIYPDIREEENRIESDELALAIVGRPNAGKSSLTNYFLGKEKQIVHHQAGTTRDPIDCYLNYKKRKLRIVDTAGLRK